MKLIRPFAITLFAVVVCTNGVAAADDEIHAGTVTFTQTAGNYTFLKVKEADNELWLVTTPIAAAVGDQIEYAGGDLMKDFESKAIKQRFDAIRFVSRIHVVGATPGIGALQMPQDDLHKGLNVEATHSAPPKGGEIVFSVDSKTVADIFAEQVTLAGQPIALQAKVIKINRNILGRNWVTLSDGTGEAPDDRIVATSQETPAVGDIVKASGVLQANVDLGAGYNYKILLEDAQFAK